MRINRSNFISPVPGVSTKLPLTERIFRGPSPYCSDVRPWNEKGRHRLLAASPNPENKHGENG